MIGGNLDEDDPNAIGILDPHFNQPPGLRYWLPEDTDACRSQPTVLRVNIPHLDPDHHRGP